MMDSRVLHVLVDSREASLTYVRDFYRQLGADVTLGMVKHIRPQSFASALASVVFAAAPDNHLIITAHYFPPDQLEQVEALLPSLGANRANLTFASYDCYADLAAWCQRWGISCEIIPYKKRTLSSDTEKAIADYLEGRRSNLGKTDEKALVRVWVQYRLMLAIITRLEDLSELVRELIEHPGCAESSMRAELLRAERYYKLGEPDMAGGSYHGEATSPNLIDRLRRRINYIAATDYNVLILGESGSGKETTAWAIHELSSRRDKPFLAVNCAGFSDDLLESEMFGYVKGSHSQAFDSQLGLLDIVDGGTLFLDELPDMGQRVQAKLLRCLETGEFRPLGGNENRYSDVRIIAAGQTALVGDPKRLRTDLKSRLGQLEVTVHPLREHERYYPGTISKLAYVLLERYTWTTVFRDGIRYELNPADIKTYQQRLEDPSIKSRLASSSWRESNIRELNNFLRRWIVFGDDEFSLLNGHPYSESETESSGRLPHQLEGEDLAAYILLPSSRQELQMFFTHHPFHDVKKAYMSYLSKVFSQIVEDENQRTGLAIKPTQKALAAVLGLTENTVSRYKQ